MRFTHIILSYMNPCPNGDPQTIFPTNEEDLFSLIDDARTRNIKIAVYRLGPCLLDWVGQAPESNRHSTAQVPDGGR